MRRRHTFHGLREVGELLSLEQGNGALAWNRRKRAEIRIVEALNKQRICLSSSFGLITDDLNKSR